MYVIDSDVLMQAKNLHYGFDFCPAFWSWLDEAHASGTATSVHKIQDEIKAGQDELAEWAIARPDFFPEPDQEVLTQLTGIAEWANGSDYDAGAKSEFLDSGDYYLIAHARAKGLRVVTHEKAADTKAKVKIPNACGALDVTCIDPFAMLRDAGAQFVLGQGA